MSHNPLIDEKKDNQVESEIDELALFRNYDPELTWTKEEETAVVRKWDFLVFPWVCVMFFFLQLDRGSISNALTSTFLKDLGINIDDNNIGTIIFISAFVFFEVPSNAIIRRVGPSVWIPFLMIAWGTVSIGTAFISDKTTYYVARFFLGVTEAGWIPGTLVYLGDFYTRAELGTRLGVFWGTITFATAFSGLISYGILGNLQGYGGLRAWQWLFLIEGLGTIIWGILSFFYLPKNPRFAKKKLLRFRDWVDERQERIAVARVFRDDPSKGTGQEEHVTWNDIWLALKDYKLWLHLITGFIGLMPNGPLSGYLPLIINSLGFDLIFSNLLTTPLYLFSMVFMIVVSWSSSRYGERALHSALGVLVSFLNVLLKKTGILLTAFVPATAVSKWVRYVFLFPLVAGFLPWHGIQAAWISGNMSPSGKRTVALAFYIMSVNLGSLPGSQIFRAADSPLFKEGFKVIIALTAVGLTLFIFQFFHYRFVNKRRAAIWNAKTEEEKEHYLSTTTDIGNARLDFKFLQ
ncbi:hypothetical protein HK096_003036 [Nowakowskiella sp. JEL0078]|nr:hypothetical protein HK096_003036 [Nowakowskiella sp. JEL0078]